MDSNLILIEKTDKPRIENLRNNYLDSLPFPQELFLELFVREADCFLVKNDDKVIGYAIAKTSSLFELYLNNESIPFADEVFGELLARLEIKNAYVKSFDYLAMSICHSHQKSSHALGCLFRDFIGNDLQEIQNIDSRLATAKDIPVVCKHLKGIFDTEKEAIDTIKSNSMNIYSINKQMIGYGIFQRTIEGRNSFDIGMYVVPEQRKQGYATYIINDLRLLCQHENWQPTLGCEIDNIGSRRTLEKAGFRTKHRLIEFKFD
jgi:RimJ/RimL family protein N-acetyltransferase